MADRRTTLRGLLLRWQVSRERRRNERDAWRKRLAAEELKRVENGGFIHGGPAGA